MMHVATAGTYLNFKVYLFSADYFCTASSVVVEKNLGRPYSSRRLAEALVGMPIIFGEIEVVLDERSAD